MVNNMTIDEIKEKLFSEKFNSLNDMNKVAEFIRNCQDKLIINKRRIEIEDILAYTKGTKEIDMNIYYEDNEISIPHSFNSLIETIIKNLQSSLKELSIPSSFITDDLSFLEGLDSINKLTINDYGFLSSEELEYIREHTNIKEIDFKQAYIVPNNYDDMVLINKDGQLVGYSKDIIFKEIPSEEEKERKDEIRIEATNIKSSDLDKIYDLINEDLTSSNRKINIKSNNQEYVFNIIDGMVNIDIKDPDMSVINDINSFFERKGIKTNSIFVSMSDNYTDIDYKELDELSKKVEIRVRAKLTETMSWDDFRGLSESMKWYKSIINDYPLSPVEKLAFAYDILKTFEYNETKTSDKFESRDPGKIIKTGHIVCAGYTSMLEEIFKELDSNIKIGEFGVTCYADDDITVRGYHSRAFAVVDDDKYNIHGAYALDPTWDSYKKNGKEKLGENYTALDLYKYFMVPFNEYKRVFEHDSNINFFAGEISHLNSDLSSDSLDKAISKVERQEEQKEGELPFKRYDSIFNYELKDVLPNYSDSQILEKFKATKIPSSTMMQIIRNVRLAEGYTQEQIDEEMNKVSRIYDSTHTEVDQLTGKML